MPVDNSVVIEEHSIMRDLCTCPRCHVVWTHYEHEPGKRDQQATMDWLQARYTTYQCPECGTWSTILPKRTFRDWWANRWRQTIEDPETAQSLGSPRDREQEAER